MTVTWSPYGLPGGTPVVVNFPYTTESVYHPVLEKYSTNIKFATEMPAVVWPKDSEGHPPIGLLIFASVVVHVVPGDPLGGGSILWKWKWEGMTYLDNFYTKFLEPVFSLENLDPLRPPPSGPPPSTIEHHYIVYRDNTFDNAPEGDTVLMQSAWSHAVIRKPLPVAGAYQSTYAPSVPGEGIGIADVTDTTWNTGGFPESSHFKGELGADKYALAPVGTRAIELIYEGSAEYSGPLTYTVPDHRLFMCPVYPAPVEVPPPEPVLGAVAGPATVGRVGPG